MTSRTYHMRWGRVLPIAALVATGCGASPTTAPTALATLQPTAIPSPTTIPTETTEPTATAEPTPKANVLRIYSSLPMTSDREQTTAIVNAITLAIEQKTDQGTVCGGAYTIDFVSLDDSTSTESSNAERAAADKDAVAYLGPFYSSAARESIPILNAVGLLMVSPSNTANDLTTGPAAASYYPTGVRTYARVVTRDAKQGLFAAEWAAALGAKSVALVADGSDYGQSVADAFEQGAEVQGITVASRTDIDAEKMDVEDMVKTLAAEKSDLIFYGGIPYGSVFLLIPALRKAGVSAPIMGPDSLLVSDFAEYLWESAGDGLYSMIASAPEAELPPAGQQFLADYKARFQSSPNDYGIYGYEAASVVLNAIDQVCAPDRKAIVDAVLGTRNYAGVLGTWSFDENGDTTLVLVQGYRVAAYAWKPVSLPELP